MAPCLFASAKVEILYIQTKYLSNYYLFLLLNLLFLFEYQRVSNFYIFSLNQIFSHLVEVIYVLPDKSQPLLSVFLLTLELEKI